LARLAFFCARFRLDLPFPERIRKKPQILTIAADQPPTRRNQRRPGPVLALVVAPGQVLAYELASKSTQTIPKSAVSIDGRDGTINDVIRASIWEIVPGIQFLSAGRH